MHTHAHYEELCGLAATDADLREVLGRDLLQGCEVLDQRRRLVSLK